MCLNHHLCTHGFGYSLPGEAICSWNQILVTEHDLFTYLSWTVPVTPPGHVLCAFSWTQWDRALLNKDVSHDKSADWVWKLITLMSSLGLFKVYLPQAFWSLRAFLLWLYFAKCGVWVLGTHIGRRAAQPLQDRPCSHTQAHRCWTPPVDILYHLTLWLSLRSFLTPPLHPCKAKHHAATFLSFLPIPFFDNYSDSHPRYSTHSCLRNASWHIVAKPPSPASSSHEKPQYSGQAPFTGRPRQLTHILGLGTSLWWDMFSWFFEHSL